MKRPRGYWAVSFASQVVQGYATKREAEEAVALIKSRAWSQERPFFLYLAWHAPRESDGSTVS